MEMRLRFLNEEFILPQMQFTNLLDIKGSLNKMRGIPINQISIFSKGKLIPENEKIFAFDELIATTILQAGEQVFVRSLEGKTSTYDITADMTVANLKNKIKQRLGIPENQQNLFFQGRLLENNQTMVSLDIKAQAVINLVASLI